jgi:hypothetical protein
MIERWDLTGTAAHLRVAIATALVLRVTLDDRWEAVLRGEAGVGASPFTDADLDPGFAPRALWRRDVTARLMLRL